jgi:hypothetical protein
MNNESQPADRLMDRSTDGPIVKMAVYCQPCLERRAMESPAKHFPGGTPMCDSCFGGRVRKPKENTMRAKFQMDPEKLKALCGQGLTNGEIGQQFGCSSALIRKRRRELGISASSRGPHSGTKRGITTRAAIATAGGNFQRPREAGKSLVATTGRVTRSVDETFRWMRRFSMASGPASTWRIRRNS